MRQGWYRIGDCEEVATCRTLLLTTDDDARWVAGSIESETESRGWGDCFLEINLLTQTSKLIVASHLEHHHRA